MHSSFILIVMMTGVMKAQLCPGITFTKKRLPAECVKVSPCGPRSIFIPRAQGSNFARVLAGWKEYLPACDGRAWGNVSLALEYAHSLDGERMAYYLFGSNRLTFTGSQVANRGPRDLLADEFGLPTTFKGAIHFEPRIDNVILDINYQIGLDEWLYGLYFECHAPIVNTRWDLGVHCNEMNNVPNDALPQFPPCYMGKNAVSTAISIREALSGLFVFGDMEQPLNFGALPCGRKQLTRVANIDVILGWNFVLKEYAHAGVFILTVVPTGNKPHSTIIFEPMIGNGNLWEIGPGISAHYDLVRKGYHILSVYFEGALTHQFKRFQIRSFDLVGRGPLSRYMLLKEFDANFNYDGNLVNAIDFSTRATHVGGSAKLDAAMKLTYYYDRWGLDVGYNIYARSKEKLRVQDDLFPSDLNNRRFGIKGTSGVCYRILDAASGDVIGTEALNATEHRSTITEAGPIDNPVAIQVPVNQKAVTWDGQPVFTSVPPIIVDVDALDLTTGAVPHQLSHKFFAHASYTALDKLWEPQFGIGGEIEFDGRKELLSSLNQWGIWFKGSIAF